jgi:[acyl-carrier-protein] S-malonyltransferase
MKKALLFPGQGSQFPGMAADLFERSDIAKERFAQANEILGFDIQEIMFRGAEEDLKRTSVTQPAIFLHSVILAEVMELSKAASMVAGHSLGEFSALVVAGALKFEDGLRLVKTRADAMQKACDLSPSTMAALVGMEDAAVEALCASLENVVPANYNSPGQLVISGSVAGVAKAIELAKAQGAKMAVQLPVNGAFHSQFMEPARVELAQGIAATAFATPICPIYQNVDGKPYTDPEQIRENLNRQLTAAVRWTQTIQQMLADGATEFVEVGPGKVLQGLVKRIERSATVSGLQSLPDAV